MANEKILVLGATGMLGHTLVRQFARRPGMDVHATVRNAEGLERWFDEETRTRIHTGVDAGNFDTVLRVISEVRPDVVINCIGIIKQLAAAKDPLATIPVNSIFPHRLALACGAAGARLVHISTDCVFSGRKGRYAEADPSDAEDLYGRSKLLGEVDYPHAVTLRTSIIGHELKHGVSLIDWFLAQRDRVRGFVHAIYSGFPTVEMARIIADYVLPHAGLHGLYHVSSEPISKYELLRLVADRYGRQIEIEPDGELRCDRSLDSSRFRSVTGYAPPSWPELVAKMYEDREGLC